MHQLTVVGVGLVLYALGAFLQIAEEWKQRGLTDTSYLSLVCLVGGPGLLAYAAWETHHLVIVGLTATPAALALVAVLLKTRDRMHATGRLRPRVR